MSYAFIFPGQGSQTVGMLKDIASNYPVIQQTFDKASDIVNYDLWDLVQNGPESKLNQTEYTQIAMFTADISLFRLVPKSLVENIKVMAGHSLGEYAALCASGALDFESSVRLVLKRSQCMNDAVINKDGAMAALVGLSNDTVEAICHASSNDNEFVTPANFNAPGQVVIAGDKACVLQAIEKAKLEHAKIARLIPVSVPCHCPLLKDAAIHFTPYLEHINVHMPQIPVVSNVTAMPYESVSDIKQLLTAQLYSPVRWVESVSFMKSLEPQHWIECGPGKVLSGLNKRIDKALVTMNLSNLEQLSSLLDN